LTTIDKHSHIVNSVVFSWDGRHLVSAGRDKVIIWDVASGTEIRNLQEDGAVVRHLAFSPDGKYLAAARENWSILLWDRKTWQAFSPLIGHTDQVVGVAFSPDGKQLASASKDGTVKLWRLPTLREMHTYRGHQGAIDDVVVTAGVNGVAFSPDGRH